VRHYLDPAREARATLTEMAGDLARLPARLDRVLTVIEKGGALGGTAAAPPVPRRWGTGWGLPAFAAVAFLGGNQWWGLGKIGLATIAWGLAGLALVVAGVRRLPAAPDEP
jgi:hypothetical protein